MKNDSFTYIFQGFQYLTDFSRSVENHKKHGMYYVARFGTIITI